MKLTDKKKQFYYSFLQYGVPVVSIMKLIIASKMDIVTNTYGETIETASATKGDVNWVLYNCLGEFSTTFMFYRFIKGISRW